MYSWCSQILELGLFGRIKLAKSISKKCLVVSNSKSEFENPHRTYEIGKFMRGCVIYFHNFHVIFLQKCTMNKHNSQMVWDDLIMHDLSILKMHNWACNWVACLSIF